MLKPVLKIGLLLSLLQLAFYSIAQRYSFENYMPVNGLASSTINQIFQDSRGYIWFATQGGGVSRFNGKEFKNFTHINGLCSNDVTCITEDKRGHIWFGTVNGISEFNGEGFTNYDKHNGLGGGIVYGIYCDTLNHIWLATHDGGIRVFDGKKFDSITVLNNLTSDETYTITQDKNGNYWFGLSNGISKYYRGKVTDYSSLKIIKGKTFFSSMVDAAGNVWFGSTSGDVIIIHNNDSVEKLELPAALGKDFIGSIAQDKKGNVWFATDHGLLKYNQGKFKLFGETEGLSVNSAQAVLVDYEDNIWTGTLAGGANLLNGEAFVQYTDKDGLATRNITAICRDPLSQTTYIGTGNGLYLFNPGSILPFKHITDVKPLEKINISSLSVDKKGVLWIAAQEGVFVLVKKGNTFLLEKEYRVIAGQKVISPSKILLDSHDNTWIATYGSGLFCICGKEEKSYSTQSKFASDMIITVFEDTRRNIWIGTQDAGVIKYNGKNFEPVSVKYASADKAVWSIAEDDKGNMFFGTGETGLCRFDGKQMKLFSTNDGLVSDYIPVLQWDREDSCLWLGGEKGIQKIQFDNNSSIKSVRNYTRQDGFNSSSVNQNGMWLDYDGLLWVGTVNGLWAYHPQLDFIKTIPSKILVSDIRLFYQKTDWRLFTDSINKQTGLPVNLTLPYNKNHLTFDIRALTTSAVRYTFKLEGQDAEWSLPTQNSEITYASINPGQTYVFKARTVNAKGVLGAEIIEFPFTIGSPWWSMWWFRLTVIICIIISLAMFIKTREKILKEQNIRLEGVVAQRTLEIAGQKKLVENTLLEKDVLLGQKEVLLKEIHHRVKNNLQTISSLLMLQSMELKDEGAKKAIVESQNRVRSIALLHQRLYQTDGLEKVEFSAFINDLIHQIKSIYVRQTVSVTIKADIPETYLLIDTAIPMGLILNELLTNSFKYAFTNNPKGEIIMKLGTADTDVGKTLKSSNFKKIKFSYWDSGTEWDAVNDFETAGTLGLKLIRLLAQQIGASVDISTQNGTEFVFIFNVNV